MQSKNGEWHLYRPGRIFLWFFKMLVLPMLGEQHRREFAETMERMKACRRDEASG